MIYLLYESNAFTPHAAFPTPHKAFGYVDAIEYRRHQWLKDVEEPHMYLEQRQGWRVVGVEYSPVAKGRNRGRR